MSWSNFVRVFDFGGQWGNSARILSGNDAAVTVKKVESLLEDAVKVLQSHERLLNQSQYKSFNLKYQRLLLKVVEVKQDVQSQEERGIFSASPADRQGSRTDRQVEHLYRETKSYHRDVLTASRRAQDEEEVRFVNQCDTDPKTESLQAQESLAPTTTWYSVITSTSPEDNHEETDSDTSTLVGREPLVAVTHIRETKSTSEGVEPSEDDAYRRILIFEQKNKRAFVIDPNPCYLNEESESLNDASLREMSQAGELLLKAVGSDDLKGFEVIGNYEEPTWVNLISETLGRLTVGKASNML